MPADCGYEISMGVHCVLPLGHAGRHNPPRKVSERQKASYVEQSFGARQACFELLHRVKDDHARRAIVTQGRAAEESLLKYGGMIFGTLFDDAVLPVPQDPERSDGTKESHEYDEENE